MHYVNKRMSKATINTNKITYIMSVNSPDTTNSREETKHFHKQQKQKGSNLMKSHAEQ